jgi:hypothetical protein
MKVFQILILLACFTQLLGQQPPICGNNPKMTSFCNQACIICDIDGFTGRNDSNTQGQAPPDFCTSQVHHMQWIGFIAGTTNLEIQITPSNCKLGNGLEVGLYESLDCQTFRRVSNCDTDIRPGEATSLINTVPLIVGQYYYFVMDGNGNDVCNWTIKVLKGSTKVSPLEIAPVINIPDEICQNSSFDISTPGVFGATYYRWTIDGVYVKDALSFTHSLEKAGVYNVCLDASNVCDQAPQACKQITVKPSKTTDLQYELCFGECLEFLNEKYCASGAYQKIISAANGCDSVINLTLVIKDKATVSSSLNVCKGDTVTIGDNKIYTGGVHQIITKNQEGCNIYMTLTVNILECDINNDVDITDVRCNGENSGSLSFSVLTGIPPFKYIGYKVENPSNIYNGNIPKLNENVVIQNLDEGNYSFTISDNYGKSSVINAFVNQPAKLQSNASISNYHDFGISCHDAKDGSIKLTPSGGTPPYTFFHTFSGLTTDSIGGLAAGIYTSIITDKLGCKTPIISEILSPSPILVKTQNKSPNCSGPTTGEYLISSVTGGASPYSFYLNSSPINLGQKLSSIFEGIYTLTTRDVNGCITTHIDTLIAAIIPDIDVSITETVVNLGDSILLTAHCTPEDQTIYWTPAENIACPTCLNTTALPLQDVTYEVFAVSKDGCVDSSAVMIRVSKNRSFVISDVITPDGNGINDKIRYLAGKDVDHLIYYNVYDRWGNLVYVTENIPSSGVTDLDWDIRFHGQDLQPGIYTWVAEVAYIDDVKIKYKGSLTILQ